jgi:hypothetical protein
MPVSKMNKTNTEKKVITTIKLPHLHHLTPGWTISLPISLFAAYSTSAYL